MLQRDVHDLCRCIDVTDHRLWWLEGVVAGHDEVGVPVARGTVVADAEGVRDGHIATLFRTPRLRYSMLR